MDCSGILNGQDHYEDVIRYADIGEHRTASRGDLLTSDWIRERLVSLGFETQVQKERNKHA
jgi:hypothetical protein